MQGKYRAFPGFTREVLSNRSVKQADSNHLRMLRKFELMRKYVRNIFFGQDVDLETEFIRRLLSNAATRDHIISTLAKAIGDKSISNGNTTLY